MYNFGAVWAKDVCMSYTFPIGARRCKGTGIMFSAEFLGFSLRHGSDISYNFACCSSWNCRSFGRLIEVVFILAKQDAHFSFVFPCNGRLTGIPLSEGGQFLAIENLVQKFELGAEKFLMRSYHVAFRVHTISCRSQRIWKWGAGTGYNGVGTSCSRTWLGHETRG